MHLVDVDSQEFADAAFRYVCEFDMNFPGCEQDSFENFVNSLPYDYDIDSVVSQIDKESKRMVTEKSPHVYYRAISKRKAISIIRAGGKPPAQPLA